MQQRQVFPIWIAYALQDKRNHIITTKMEHPSVLEVCKFFESNGFEITYLPVNKSARSHTGVYYRQAIRFAIKKIIKFLSIKK